MATRDESIQFFDKHHREFEELRDLLTADPNKKSIVYGDGDYSSREPKSHFSAKRLSLYATKLKMLGLSSMSKHHTSNNVELKRTNFALLKQDSIQSSN